MRQANRASAVTWSEPHSAGLSDFVVFGSTPHCRNAIMVARTRSGGVEGFEVIFNDASLRRPKTPMHQTAAHAKAHAARCLSLPIPERGLRSRALNARIEAERLAGPDCSDEDLLAAAQLACAPYPEIDPASVTAAIRSHQ